MCLKLYRIFKLEMVQRDPRVRIDEVWTKYEDKFQDWFKDYVSLKSAIIYTLPKHLTTCHLISRVIFNGLIGVALKHRR